MIVDITGIILKPGNMGRDCFGNGEHFDEYGNLIECCCNECDYMMCCLGTHSNLICENCKDIICPHSKSS